MKKWLYISSIVISSFIGAGIATLGEELLKYSRVEQNQINFEKYKPRTNWEITVERNISNLNNPIWEQERIIKVDYFYGLIGEGFDNKGNHLRTTIKPNILELIVRN